MKSRTISQIAREAGVGVETIRYYQRIGLISPPARPARGGYRQYTDRDVTQLRFIREAKEFGFTLKEIGQLIGLVDASGCDCKGVVRLAQGKRAQLEETQRRLARMQDTLTSLIEACDGSDSVDVCSLWEGTATCTSASQQIKSGGSHERKKKA